MEVEDTGEAKDLLSDLLSDKRLPSRPAPFLEGVQVCRCAGVRKCLCQGGLRSCVFGRWAVQEYPPDAHFVVYVFYVFRNLSARQVGFLESEGHGKEGHGKGPLAGPLALGAWRSKNTRPTHILWCMYSMYSAIYLRDKLVLESEGHADIHTDIHTDILCNTSLGACVCVSAIFVAIFVAIFG
jgi:hypothetical protein